MDDEILNASERILKFLQTAPLPLHYDQLIGINQGSILEPLMIECSTRKKVFSYLQHNGYIRYIKPMEQDFDLTDKGRKFKSFKHERLKNNWIKFRDNKTIQFILVIIGIILAALALRG